MIVYHFWSFQEEELQLRQQQQLLLRKLTDSEDRNEVGPGMLVMINESYSVYRFTAPMS